MGYFERVGLAYEMAERATPPSAGSAGKQASSRASSADDESAYQEFVQNSRTCNVASTSHWAVGLAASAAQGQLWTQAYSIMPAGIFVQPESPLREPEELAGAEVVVGRHSGSHFSAAHSLEQVIAPSEIRFRFIARRGDRVKVMLDGGAQAANVYGLESYILEQRGFRKVLDTSFLVTFLIVGSPSIDDVQKYFEALQLAQRSIDEEPERHKHYLHEETPTELRPLLDMRKCGTGERLVFEPYGADLYERIRAWMITREIVAPVWVGKRSYDEVKAG